MPPIPPPVGPSHPRPPHHKSEPISPVLDSLAYQRPPKKEKRSKSLLVGLVLGTIITALIGGLLWQLRISANVILPVLAPIWVGSITLIYSFSSKN